MKKEFITVYGKVVLDNRILLIKNTVHPFSNTILYREGSPFIFLVIFLLQFVRPAIHQGIWYFRIAFWFLIVLSQVKKMYETLFKKSFAKKIPLEKIRSVEQLHLNGGLETSVILHLRSGRKRTILFRTLEKEYEAFASLLSEYHAVLKPAVIE